MNTSNSISKQSEKYILECGFKCLVLIIRDFHSFVFWLLNSYVAMQFRFILYHLDTFEKSAHCYIMIMANEVLL